MKNGNTLTEFQGKIRNSGCIEGCALMGRSAGLLPMNGKPIYRPGGLPGTSHTQSDLDTRSLTCQVREKIERRQQWRRLHLTDGKTMNVSEDEVTAAIIAYWQPDDAPKREDGWFQAEDMMKALGIARGTAVNRLKRAVDKGDIEEWVHIRMHWYRFKQKPPG